MELDHIYEGATLGILLIAVGELFGVGIVSLAGVSVFVAFVLAGFPLMTAELVTGTLREGSQSTLDVDFGTTADSHV